MPIQQEFLQAKSHPYLKFKYRRFLVSDFLRTFAPENKIKTEVFEVKMEVKVEVNSLRSWKLKRTIPSGFPRIQSYRPARSALLPASSAGLTPYLTSSYNFRDLNFLNFQAQVA